MIAMHWHSSWLKVMVNAGCRTPAVMPAKIDHVPVGNPCYMFPYPRENHRKTAGFSRSRAALCSEPLADKGTFFCNKDNMLLAKWCLTSAVLCKAWSLLWQFCLAVQSISMSVTLVHYVDSGKSIVRLFHYLVALRLSKNIWLYLIETVLQGTDVVIIEH